MIFTSAVVYSIKKHLSNSDSKPKRMNFLFAKPMGGTMFTLEVAERRQ